MQYVLKQKLVSLGNNFTIKDVDVLLLYVVSKTFQQPTSALDNVPGYHG
jgi:uncharacterized protein YxjI